MKNIWIILLIKTITVQAFAQDKSFCPTYVYEGVIKTDMGQKLNIHLSFLIFLDSTLMGSYYYSPQNGALEIVGHLNKDNSFYLVERDGTDKITGIFDGTLSNDKSKASGWWTSPEKDRVYVFKLEKSKSKSFWDILRKNRGLYEYKSLKSAIKGYEKVLSVDVEDQGLTSLPDDICKLSKIQSISLLGNDFTEFPVLLSTLTTLDEISLSSNKLQYIGPEIGELENLKVLIINYNQLKSLPKEIGNLSNLLYLDIGDNKLEHLPEEIKYLEKLQELHADGNKFSSSERSRIKKLLPNCIIYFER